MAQRVLLTAAVVVSLFACTADDDPVSTSAPPKATTVDSLPGRLVTIDDTGNVVVMEPDGSQPVNITDDAGPQARYAQPSWSPSSELLAWSHLTADGFGLTLSDGDGGDPSRISMSNPPFYLHWSPDGESMGVLHNSDAGLIDFELVDILARTATVAAQGVPFYFSWNPTSDGVAAHVAGDQFLTISLNGDQAGLGETSLGYAAPHWTPEGIFHLGPRGLEVLDPEGERRLIVATAGPVAFAANSQGTKLAIQARRADGPVGVGVAMTQTPNLPTDSVVVFDTGTGEITTVTEGSSVGFFWSPDGESLLVLQPSGGIGEANILVWDEGGTIDLGALTLHPSLVRDVLQFFDQYAQSLSVWSADSAAVVLPGAIDEEPGIWVYMVDGTDVARVAGGSWAVFSGRP
jgi:hypothetical protein